MANWHYFNENREKIGPISGKELKQLAQQGTITPEDFVEDPNGRTGLAKDVKGLTFPKTAQPEPEELFIATPPPPVAKQFFCTNCGNAVDEQAVACMSCGAKPFGHKKFCRRCGVSLNPEQVVCVKCETEISTNTLAATLMTGIHRAIPSKIPVFIQRFLELDIPVSSHGMFGEVLIADSGRRNKAIRTWWAMFVIGAIAIAATLGGTAIYLMIEAAHLYQAHRGSDSIQMVWDLELRASILGWVVLFSSIAMPVYGAFYHRCIAGTYIQVQENGIEGKGAGRGFIWGDPRLFGFQLNYNQITSVTATDTAVIIHAAGTPYRCYVANPGVIQRAIAGQQQKKVS